MSDPCLTTDHPLISSNRDPRTFQAAVSSLASARWAASVSPAHAGMSPSAALRHVSVSCRLHADSSTSPGLPARDTRACASRSIVPHSASGAVMAASRWCNSVWNEPASACATSHAQPGSRHSPGISHPRPRAGCSELLGRLGTLHRLRRNPACHSSQQSIGIDRLGHKVVHPGCPARLDILLQNAGRERHNGDVGDLAPGPGSCGWPQAHP